MLLLYQIGTVKVGEVVRYTVTYTPSHDRILPSPEFLYLRIKNSSAIALRAAFVHGPYTLSVAAYPSNFDPNEKFPNPRRYGVPEFEPMLKAGGTWNCHLIVPDDIRQSAGTGRHGYFGGGPEQDGESVSWIIEVASQVIFSTSAAVNYEIVLARDEKSLNLSSTVPVIGSQAQVPQPGRVSDYQQNLPARDGRRGAVQPKGVFSRAIHLKVEDTATLWNTPPLPGWDEDGRARAMDRGAEVPFDPVSPIETDGGLLPPTKPKKVHLVVLTHGLHGNLGADMLFLKESIDAGVKQAKIDAKARRAREREAKKERESTRPPEPDVSAPAGEVGVSTEQGAGGSAEEDDDEDEEVMVRGYSGNATRTEKGIKYMGKRLARYVLSMTYPDQPFLPAVKAAAETVHAVKGGLSKQDIEGKPAHKHSTIHKTPPGHGARLYKITKISFIAHSLGGLVQMYAIAYIQKHSPQFFDLIEPINFIALASPFLGLNHENPLYVKFGLDFGLVGRTGQDLGLTWRAPTIARSGWGALVSNLGENAHKRVMGDAQPESKPLLRILPTGPAHNALKKFRNRTVYSNVVNDGIVPLRTSCLLFLDWQGLGRVEKARREVGLVETVVGFGWAELTGTNVTSPRLKPWSPEGEAEKQNGLKSTGPSTPTGHHENSHEVPQPPTNATLEDDRQSLRSVVASPYPVSPSHEAGYTSTTNNNNPFSGFFNLFKGSEAPKSPKSPPPTPKQNKIYQRSQTLRLDDSSNTNSASSSKSKVTSGHELAEEFEGVSAPPRTSFFESAVDLLNPMLPSVEYLIDPSKRPRAIFHDRIYHPSDIPPLPLKRRIAGSLAMRRRSYHRTTSGSSTGSSPFPSPGVIHEDSGLSQRDYDDLANTNPDRDPADEIDSSSLKVEEKIARAYHRGLSWRKVLVKLEPDAHNNLFVRRMFANAFGWPVVKHLVDAHFSDSAAARTRDDEETSAERARNPAEPPDEHGGETKSIGEDEKVGGLNISRAKETDLSSRPPLRMPHWQKVKDDEGRTASETFEALDSVSDLPSAPKPGSTSREPVLGTASPGHPAQTGTRPPYHDRLDSVTWSERDWADSADESDGDDHHHHGEEHHLAYGNEEDVRDDRPADDGQVDEKVKGVKATEREQEQVSALGLNPLGVRGAGAWNWTEKIVGKGAGGAALARAGSQRKSPLARDPVPEGGVDSGGE